MANHMTKKEYDEIKEKTYTVKAFSLEHGRQVSYVQYVGLKEAFDFCVKQQKEGHLTIMDLHYKMQFAYVQDGTVITDFEMTRLLLKMYDENIDNEDFGLVQDRQKVEYLQNYNYDFYDAYNIGQLHSKYNEYKNTSAS